MSWAAPPARRAGARAGGARDYWQKREAACQLCDFLMHRARDEDAQLEAFHNPTGSSLRRAGADALPDHAARPSARLQYGRKFNGHHYTFGTVTLSSGSLQFGFGSKPLPATNLSASISFISATISRGKQVLYRQTHYISRISTPRRDALIRCAREIPIRVSKPASLHLPRQALTARVIRNWAQTSPA